MFTRQYLEGKKKTTKNPPQKEMGSHQFCKETERYLGR